MRILSFLGFGVVFILFTTTWYLSYQDCYNWDYAYNYTLLNQDIYLFINAAFYPTYDILANCPASQCHIDFTTTDSYVFWYGFSGLYFTFISIWVHQNISNYKAKDQYSKNAPLGLQ
jgi:hypothetical protein